MTFNMRIEAERMGFDPNRNYDTGGLDPWCLRYLVSMSTGQTINPVDDRSIMRLYASVEQHEEGGDTSKCRVGNCTLQCITTLKDGRINLIEESGEALCDLPDDVAQEPGTVTELRPVEESVGEFPDLG